MRISDKGIILQSIKHGDRKNILKIFTANHGLLTVIGSVSKSSASRIKAGSILPLSLVEIEIIMKESRELFTLTEATAYYLNDHIHESISKLTIAQFLNEIMIRTLKEQSSNPSLFEFIETCIKYLNDSRENFINLHLYFLIELSKYLGFEPQNNFNEAHTPYFDSREGRFSEVPMTFPLGLTREDSAFFSLILDSDLLTNPLSNSERQKLLELLIVYYRFHIPGFNELKSVDVLKEVLSG
jgi:DNA repair protein RecO (recombination protein O)